MHNGHDARTQAVIAHAKPKANTHTREVTRETLPEDVQTLIDMGAAAVFPPGTVIPDAALSLLERLNRKLGYAQRAAE